jgi:protein-S-isoprenylcysteine O-methyltransferase Ste14
MPMRYLELRFPPPLVAVTIAAVMWFAASLPQVWPPSSLGHLFTSVILLAIGVAIALSAVISFRRAQTTVNPLRPETSTSLVTTGIFARTRNPMYLGMLIGLLAWAVYLAFAPALLGPVAFALYITRFQIIPEERAMRSLFGPAFSEYSQRVRRWV